MNTGLLFDNLVAYSLQIGMLVGVAAVVPALLRLRQPGGKLIYWQILLVACLLLPLQPWKQVVSSGMVDVRTVIAAVQPVHRATPAPSMPRSEMALLLVLAGIAIRLGCLAAGFWKLRRYRRHSRPLDPAPAWSVEASLLVSEEVASPVTFGWRKPVVLLPAHFATLDAKVQEAILCHEILHVRRGDWLFTVAEEVVRAAFWFHPAIWWLLGEIGLAREQEVDRLAIEITNQRDDYMDALLAIAGARAQLDLAPAPLFLRKRHLKHRVILILKEARMSRARLISTLTTGFAMLAAACWLVTGAFPLTAEPQIVSDAAGVSVNLNGSTLMHRIPVHYPAGALEHGVQGSVSVQVKLDGSGSVADAQVLNGPEALRRAALESVLEWHFTHDEANTVRIVQIGFELPKETAAPEIATVAKVTPGDDPIVAYRNGSPVRRSAMPAAPTSFRITHIIVSGLPEPSRTQLLASLPAHEGDVLSAAEIERTIQAVNTFDEHLRVRRTTGETPESGPADLSLQIIAPAGVAPEGESTAQRIKVGGVIMETKIVTKVQPMYPQLAKTARVSGVVHLAAVIAKDGTIQELHSLGGPALLIQAAMDAVRQWVYEPVILNGAPATVDTTIDVNFTLNE